MQTLALPEITQLVEAGERAGNRWKDRRPAIRQPKMILCSGVHGRERWYVDVLEDNPRLAAAVELVLRSEEGIEAARVNPSTGRVLVHFRSHLLRESIQDLIARAIEFGPMSREEFSALRPRQSASFSAGHFILAEIGCEALKMIFLGGCCPAALAAAGLLLLLHRHA